MVTWQYHNKRSTSIAIGKSDRATRVYLNTRKTWKWKLDIENYGSNNKDKLRGTVRITWNIKDPYSFSRSQIRLEGSRKVVCTGLNDKIPFVYSLFLSFSVPFSLSLSLSLCFSLFLSVSPTTCRTYLHVVVSPCTHARIYTHTRRRVQGVCKCV